MIYETKNEKSYYTVKRALLYLSITFFINFTCFLISCKNIYFCLLRLKTKIYYVNVISKSDIANW